jgi:hypothetical protein
MPAQEVCFVRRFTPVPIEATSVRNASTGGDISPLRQISGVTMSLWARGM